MGQHILYSKIWHTYESSSNNDNTFSTPISDLLKSQAQMVTDLQSDFLEKCLWFLSDYEKKLSVFKSGRSALQLVDWLKSGLNMKFVIC